MTCRPGVLVLLCAAAGLCGACTDGGPPPVYPGPAVCVLGGGFIQFVPLSDGDSVPLIYGPQGGHHVWGSARVQYVDAKKLKLTYSLVFPDGTSYSKSRDEVDLTTPQPDTTGFAPPAAQGWGESLGSRAVVSDPALVAGKHVTLRLDASDAYGRTCTDMHDIVPTE